MGFWVWVYFGCSLVCDCVGVWVAGVDFVGWCVVIGAVWLMWFGLVVVSWEGYMVW